MKKIFYCLVIIVIILMFGIFKINTLEKETDVTKERTKVGVIFNSNMKDSSWNQSHYEGLKICEEKLNLEMFWMENVPEDESCQKVMEGLIGKGCKIIICTSFNYGQWVSELAKKYPAIFFFHASGVQQEKNLTTYFGRIYQARYLAGIVAGMQTKTNEIGYVAAFELPEVVRGIDAFALGVSAVNKAAKVNVIWSNSWMDEDMALAATKKLHELCPDMDILTVHTNASSPIEYAEANSLWSIGYHFDSSDKYSDKYLTSCVWKWEEYYMSHILQVLQGKLYADNYWEGLDAEIVALGPLSKEVAAGVPQRIELEAKNIVSGKKDVFFGPIWDNEGNERVEDGENMPDEVLLNELDWYVKGVVVHE